MEISPLEQKLLHGNHDFTMCLQTDDDIDDDNDDDNDRTIT